MLEQDRGKGRAGLTLIELLVVIAIIAVLIALLLPAVQKVRESANRAKCQNNLKQLALACQTYHDTYQAFPKAQGETNATATKPPGYVSEIIPLLPFLEQGNLYQQLYNLAVQHSTYMGGPFFGFTPGSDSATPLAVLACPSDQLPFPPLAKWNAFFYGLASYLGNNGSLPYTFPSIQIKGLDGIFVPSSEPLVSLLGITDGSSNTILFGERSNYDPNWPTYRTTFYSSGPDSQNSPLCAAISAWGHNAYGSPPLGSGYYSLNTPLPLPPAFSAIYYRQYTYGSGHPGGANFVFCDGSVHFLSNAINNTPTLLPALSTRANGEVIDESSF